MLNFKILNAEVQSFINENINTDISSLIFKGSPFPYLSIQEIAEQIVAKKKCKFKLPLWFQTENIYYPNKLNIEQTSSETTATYKSKLVSGKTLIDLTGGFGIDAYYFSQSVNSITHCEINKELSEIVSHNLNQLDSSNIVTKLCDGIQFIQKEPQIYDWIYIDPSRRNDVKGKVFLLEDCLPNVPKHLNELFNKSKNILIKVSPILDISSALGELKHVKEIHVVAVNNEVKELLFLLSLNYDAAIHVYTVNIKNNKNQEFNFQLGLNATSYYSEPLQYLYEPNAAILKAGAFHQVSEHFDLSKLNQHSHLYTSDHLIEFPGRSFKILKEISYDKKQLKKLIPTKKANIKTRNFPETVAQIRKKTGLKDGGNLYLFFTTNLNNKPIVLICEKVS